MNRLSVVVAAVSMAAIAFSAPNEWDGGNSGYNGAFGTTNGLPEDWSTATNIYTVVPDNSGNLGYLSLLNGESTTVNINHSFNGFIDVGLSSVGSLVTNTFVAGAGVVVTGAMADAVAEIDRSAPRDAVSVVGYGGSPFNPEYTTSVRFDGGNYVGAAGADDDAAQGGLGYDGVDGDTLKYFSAKNASFYGGKGAVLSSIGENAGGGRGLFLFDVKEIELANSQLVGGDGGTTALDRPGENVKASGGAGFAYVPFFLFGGAAGSLDVYDSVLNGGAGGDVTSVSGSLSVNADGGAGISFDSLGFVIVDTELNGGAGGLSVVASGAANQVSAVGGDGLLVDDYPSVTVPSGYLNNVTLVGGMGGNVSSLGSGSTGDASGGDGGDLVAFDNLIVSGGMFVGGAGGTVESDSDAVANGGDGLAAVGDSGDNDSVTITNGSFFGGNAGTAMSANGIALADGGDALKASKVILNIYGGTFVAGSGETANGVSGNDGYAGRFTDVDLTITNGSFNTGRGLLLQASTASSNIVDISAGSFSAVQFDGSADIDISGGTFANDLLFTGEGAKKLSLVSAQTTGNIFQNGGDMTVNNWDDDQFRNTVVSNGTIAFNNRSFNLHDGYTLMLQADTSVANFNDGLLVSAGGVLDIGEGEVFAGSNFTAQAGSTLKSVLVDDGSEIKAAMVKGDNLVFEDGTTWVLSGDTTNIVDKFVIASATTSATNEGIAFEYTAPQWWRGISGTTNETGGLGVNMYAVVGDETWDNVFDAPEGSEYQKALQDLSTVVVDGTDAYAYLTGLSPDQAQSVTFNTSVRKAEMANALIGLQGVFADQIQDRTRSYRMLGGYGISPVSPAGAAGPEEWYGNTKDWMRDHMPSWNAKADARKVADEAPVPPVMGDPNNSVGKPYIASSSEKGSDYDALKEEVDELLPSVDPAPYDVPTTYQVWGRGYGSYLNQDATDGYAGYNANIYGGIVGVDKRFENLLAGLGGGYARTLLNGDAGNDGTANTGYASGYVSVMKDKFYMDASLSYAFNAVETEYVFPGSADKYSGDYDANTLGGFIGGGYGISAFNDKFVLTPELSFLATFYSRDAYTETSSLLPDKQWDSYDTWSMLSSLGATFSMIQKIESFNLEMEFQPELRLHWLHEFNSEMDDEEFTYAGITNPQTIGAALQAREEDLVQLGGGVRFSKWQSDTSEFGVDVDGVIGQDYQSIILSAKVMHRF